MPDQTAVGRATFAANSLEASPGVASTTAVSVRLTSLDVGDVYLVSGDYTSSTAEPLEAFGAAVLTNAGNLQIAAAIPAVLRIPVKTRAATSPSSANLYYLDEVTATWVAEGTATLVSDPAGDYYEGNVGRVAQWMVGAALTAPVTVHGCVEDDVGAPVSDASIVAEGISYSGLAYVYTDSNGQFQAQVRNNSQLLVSGRRGAVLTNAAAVTTVSADVTLPACLTLPSSNAAVRSR